MAIVGTRDLDEAWENAMRAMRRPTHWLMSQLRYDALKMGRDADLAYPAAVGAPDTYRGLPIHIDRDGRVPLGEAYILDGPLPDDDREAELRQQLHALQFEYQNKAKPLARELAAIEARKPPRLHVDEWPPLSNEAMRKILDRMPMGAKVATFSPAPAEPESRSLVGDADAAPPEEGSKR